jgi:PAS domain S-box-containing protein
MTAADDLGSDRLLDAVDHAVIVTDPDLTIRLFNSAAAELYGWPAAEVVGRSILDVATPEEDEEADSGSDLLEVVRSGRKWSGELVMRRRDGSTFLASITASPVLDEGGAIIAIVGVADDITERRDADELLRRSEQRLRVALLASQLATWGWDQATGEIEWNESMDELFGLPPGGFGGDFEDYVALVHPFDRERVVETLLTSVEEGMSGEHGHEYRIIRPDGTIRWVEGHGRSIENEEGNVVGLLGVARDITERRLAEVEREQLLAAEAAARGLAEAARNRVQFLSEATSALTESVELRSRLEALAELVVPQFSDGCGIYLLDDDGQPRLQVLRHSDPDVAAALVSLDERFPIWLDAPHGTGAAIRERTTSWVRDLTPQLLEAATVDEEQRAELASIGLQSLVAVPLVGSDVVIGAVNFFMTGDRDLSEDDVRLAEELCLRAGIAVENAQLAEAQENDSRQLRFLASLLHAQSEAGIEGSLVVDVNGNVLTYNRRFLEIWGFDPELAKESSEDSLLEEATNKVAAPSVFLERVRYLYANPSGLVQDEILLADGRTLDRHGAPLKGDDGEYFGWAWYFRDITAERHRQAEITAIGEQFAALARTLQQSLLPPALPRLQGVDLAARYHPALEGLEVGGDFYDVFPVGDAWVIVLGDVCGKGAAAAALTALVRYTLRAAAMHNDDPALMLVELNAAMLADNPDDIDGRFATVCCMRMVSGPGQVDVTVACGGHAPAHVTRADGTVEAVGTYGTILGVVPDVHVSSAEVTLYEGDSLIAVTDGVLEARDAAGDQFEDAGLAELLASVHARSAADIAAQIERRALAHQGGIARDDIAIVVAQVERTTT